MRLNTPRETLLSPEVNEEAKRPNGRALCILSGAEGCILPVLEPKGQGSGCGGSRPASQD